LQVGKYVSSNSVSNSISKEGNTQSRGAVVIVFNSQTGVNMFCWHCLMDSKL